MELIKKHFIEIITLLFIFACGFYSGHNYVQSKFDEYKLEISAKYEKEINDLVIKQKEQTEKDNLLVIELNEKISSFKNNYDNDLSNLSLSLHNNSSIKSCKLDSESLKLINKSLRSK